MNGLSRCRALVLLLLLAPVAWAERQAGLPQGALIVTPAQLADAQAAAAARADHWTQLADAGAFAVLSADMAAASGVAAELALSALVRHLRDAASGRTEQGRALLTALSSRTPMVWMRHEETRGDWFVPALDPGGEASSALWVMGRDQARERWRQRLLEDPGSVSGGFVDDADARSAAEALRVLPERVLEEVAGQALGSGGGGTEAVRPSIPQDERAGAAWPGPVLLALAEETRSAPLYGMALARLQPAERVVAVATLADHLAPAEAQLLLKELASDPAVGSAAVMALGRFVAEPAVKAWLVDALGTPRIGASAAAALARHGGPAVVATLEDRMAKDGNPAVWRDLVLALRLHGSPGAERALRRIAGDPRLPASVAAELQP